MANAAEKLAETFRRWEYQNESSGFFVSDNERSDAQANTRQAAQAKADAANAIVLVDQVDTALTSLENSGIEVGVYREVLPEWRELCFEKALGSATLDQVRNARRLAQSLATHLGLDGPSYTDEERDTLSIFVDDLIAELKSGDDLRDDVRRHLFDVTAHVRAVLDRWEAFEDFELRTAVEQLVGALVATIPADDNGRESRLKDHLRTMGEWLRGRANGAVDLMIGQVIQGELPPGL